VSTITETSKLLVFDIEMKSICMHRKYLAMQNGQNLLASIRSFLFVMEMPEMLFVLQSEGDKTYEESGE
jgi:hypothetical protein